MARVWEQLPLHRQMVRQQRCSRCQWRRLLGFRAAALVGFLLCAAAAVRLWSGSGEEDEHSRRRHGSRRLQQDDSLACTGCSGAEEEKVQCRQVKKLPERRCEEAGRCEGGGRGVINYLELHFCELDGEAWVSVPLLVAGVVLAFYVLAETAEHYFSPAVSAMVTMLQLTPSTGGVTLLALGNGAPDLFASLAAIRGGNARIGLGAILSAGTFVSTFVVGCVALAAAPFSLPPFPFVRDLLFYATAVCMLLLVYLSGVVYFWQAAAFVALYALFVLVVILTDEVQAGSNEEPDGASSVDKSSCGSCALTGKLQMPVEVLLKATIPVVSPANWSRGYATANVVLCPLLLELYMCSAKVPLDLVRNVTSTLQVPLWCLVALQSLVAGVAAYKLIWTEPCEKGRRFLPTAAAFVMSVFWISFMAGELLGCLAALGVILDIPSALLGLTVLAWGNSVGDLMGDVAVAKNGQPALAMAGCFAGPMFNMLVGLGLALAISTAQLQSPGYIFRVHPSILIAFGFLLTGLSASLLFMAHSRFVISRFWGYTLISWYVLFIIVTIAAA